jgi:hypothetical protein
VISGKWVYGNYTDQDSMSMLMNGVYIVLGVFGFRIIMELLYAFPPQSLLNCLKPKKKNDITQELDP